MKYFIGLEEYTTVDAVSRCNHASLWMAVNMTLTTDCKWSFFSLSLLSTARSDSIGVGSDRLLSTTSSRSRLSFSAAFSLSVTKASLFRSSRDSCTAVMPCSRRLQHELPPFSDTDSLFSRFAVKASRMRVMISTSSRFCKTAGTPPAGESPSNTRVSSSTEWWFALVDCTDCALINWRSRSLSAASRSFSACSRRWWTNSLPAIEFNNPSFGDRLSHTLRSLILSVETVAVDSSASRRLIVPSSFVSRACTRVPNASSTIRSTWSSRVLIYSKVI